jgi:DNA-binding transcriptional ArsR family regulator
LTEKRGTVDRILNAFGHPVRRRILLALVDGPASASGLARRFKMDLGIVSYHLNRVLAKQCGVVELVDTVPRRGSVEKFYELKVKEPLDLPAAGAPGSWEEMVWAMALGHHLFETMEGTKSRG